MKSDCKKATVCQERKKDPIEMFHSGQVVKICAPMVRYSKLAFRTLVRKYSCDLCYTPMIVAADFVKSIKARDSEFTTNQGDCPLIVQFAANDARLLSDAACIVCPYANGIDINCGCPQRWAMAEGYGACLINKPELVQDMVKQVKNQVENPRFSVSIKIRIHDDLTRTVDLCRKAEATGVSWISVHGRTVEERHQPVHYDAIKIIKENMSIPVIANGDIKSLKEAENVWQITGADGVMVARGLLANPAMFAGYEETPLKCIWDWVDIALELGTPYMCFHQHLMYMMEKITSRQEKRVFNALSSTSAVLDYLTDHYGILGEDRTRCEEKKMTLQWAAVATFLYAEIGLILIFCLPFIPPQRWQKIFSFHVWGKIATFWNKAFLTIIVLLIVLFLDAVREVRKYSTAHTIEKSATSRPNAYEHTQMKLFRSQRNLYISGFSLFFWLVLRRLVTLITQLAKELSAKRMLKNQAENTNEAAKQYMEENEKLKQMLKSQGMKEEYILEAENKKLVEDQEKLKTELKKTSDALFKAQNDLMTMKMQSERLSKEYDRLLKEHSELQGHLEKGNKKGL
ncbi:tRNA-dihydrouridine(20a/20b) synthase [NAD(P)+]-like [Dasypus novemcinctus]|uniref:tRNA-dihydrouridine(20a/20b) synthase [NAD(P)+]-like n=1 Tax=Dasypus novemcinctus TaxID=9361 RepID=UPI0039C9E881